MSTSTKPLSITRSLAAKPLRRADVSLHCCCCCYQQLCHWAGNSQTGREEIQSLAKISEQAKHGQPLPITANHRVTRARARVEHEHPSHLP
jgi:hypothetical protein